MSPADVEREFSAAKAHHEAGRLREAELGYRQILAVHPEHPGALHMLGLLAAQAGHAGPAAEILRRAAQVNPGSPEVHNHLGLVLFSLGKLDEAVAEFRTVIALAPGFAEAHNSLGAALKRRGDVDAAMACYREALRLQPGFPEAANNLGTALQERGAADEAEAAFRTAIASRPTYAEALSNLGNALRARRRPAEAAELLGRAAVLRPDVPEIHYNLGITLHEDGRLEESASAYRRALALRPDYVAALNNLGNVLHELTDFDGAIAVYERAVALQPDLADGYNNLGRALKEVGRLDEAIAAYRRAVSLRIDFAEAHSNLGNALVQAGELDEAVAMYRRALASRSDYAEAYNNLGNALGQVGERDQAGEALRQALEIAPGMVDAQWNMALALLLRGDFERGWAMYEIRNRAKAVRLDPEFVNSFWDGSDLAGRRILLLGEQGLGDTIHFVRYIPMVRERGGEVALLCQSKLRKLMEGQLGIRQVESIGEQVPAFDVCCPLMSLPFVFKTRPETIPGNVPYLRADPVRAARWAEKIRAESAKLRVGLVWAGNPTFGNDRYRSMPLDTLAPLAEAGRDVIFYSLQKGPAAEQAKRPPAGMRLVDDTADLDDMIDTAALVSCLDLVISVDTAVAHLAGALAKPVWTMIPFAPDWRWQLGRTDSPWYPTMRLFRQRARNEWGTPVREARDALTELARLARG